MSENRLITRSFIVKNLSATSDRSLKKIETTLTDRMGNIAKFCSWPALEQSLAQDIAMIWREQKSRDMVRGVELTALGSTSHKLKGELK